MKRGLIACMAAGLLIGSETVRADIVANLVSDGGFEGISGTEPETTTAPWFSNEETKWEIQQETSIIHGGASAVVWQYYGKSPALIQNLGVVVEAGKDYEVDLWHAIGEASGQAAHTNATTFNVSIWTSPTVDGSYTYVAGKFGIETTAGDATYQNYTGTIESSKFDGLAGEYMQLRIAKANQNTTHRLFVDDVSFGAVIPEPATLGMVAVFGASLIFFRRKFTI